MRVLSVERAGKADVFNMEVEDTHDFVVQGGVISHNCADETRYLCMARPIKPRMPVPVSKFNESALHVYLDLEEKDLLPTRTVPRMERINAD